MITKASVRENSLRFISPHCVPTPSVQSYAERCQIFTDGLFVVAHFYCMGFYMIYKADYNEFARNM